MSVHPFMAVGVARACRVPRRRGTCQGWTAAFRELESMDCIEAISTLLAVVHAGSLSAASRQLQPPIATVSRRIEELEAHLTRGLLSRTDALPRADGRPRGLRRGVQAHPRAG